MKRLVIIGNGFDLHHKMKTNYLDYRDFLLRTGKKEIVESFECNEEFSIEYLWNNIEKFMGSISYENAYCYLIPYSSDDWRDSAHHDFQYEIKKMTDYWPGLKDNLREWILTVEYTKRDEKIVELIESANYFLSFNYTNTLEKLYGVSEDKIFYLHGTASKDGELILGHREDDWYPEWDRNNHDEDARLLEASGIMDEHFAKTKKQIENIIESNKGFFERDDFNEIYVLGLSYNETDRFYLKKIAECNKAKWFFNWYTLDDEKCIDDYARSIGVNDYKKINIDLF